MASKILLLSFFLMIISSSYMHVGLCDDANPLSQLLPGLGSVTSLQDAKCMQKLLPCQPYVKSATPPQACCGPLKEMQENEKECLCSIVDNPQLLQSFHVSQEDIVRLPKACGLDVDPSKCNNTSAASSPTSTGEDDAEGEASDSAAKSSTKMINPYKIFVFVALLTTLVSTY